MAVSGKEKKPKTLKEMWKDRLLFMSGRRGYVTIDQIADVLGVGRSTIVDDLNQGLFPKTIKKKGENSRGRVFIPIDSAKAYIDNTYHLYDDAPQVQPNKKTGEIRIRKGKIYKMPEPVEEKEPVQLRLFG